MALHVPYEHRSQIWTSGSDHRNGTLLKTADLLPRNSVTYTYVNGRLWLRKRTPDLVTGCQIGGQLPNGDLCIRDDLEFGNTGW